MVSLTINNKKVSAEEGQTLLEVAESLGIGIPVMCRNAAVEHFTSCMICLVKDLSSGRLLPSCSVLVQSGMDILTEDEELKEARRVALELLLSEHVGDCEAPCRIACPAFMDIPLMNRLLAAGEAERALAVVMHDIALPGVLGRICPAPCEGACKRKPIDEAVSVCLLKRYAADQGMPIPRKEKKKATGKRVAVIGAGPAGLAAAYYLQMKGIQAVVVDKYERAGGSLRYDIPDDHLDKVVLDREVGHIEQTGVVFRLGQHIDHKGFTALRKDYDAVVVATGNYVAAMDGWGLENNGKQLLVNKATYQTNLDRVFAIGNANRSMQLAIRSQAQGKEVAVAIEQLFRGEEVTGETRRFNSSFGRLLPEEHAEYLKEGTTSPRQHPATGDTDTGDTGAGSNTVSGATSFNGSDFDAAGFDAAQARTEAARCLHCDCRKPDSCSLRLYAEAYGASKKRFSYGQRKPLTKQMQHTGVVYEPGKCIKCGICVRLTAKHQETFGFTFIGRGFDVEIGVPFNEPVSAALEKTAGIVADACPTGALSAP